MNNNQRASLYQRAERYSSTHNTTQPNAIQKNLKANNAKHASNSEQSNQVNNTQNNLFIQKTVSNLIKSQQSYNGHAVAITSTQHQQSGQSSIPLSFQQNQLLTNLANNLSNKHNAHKQFTERNSGVNPHMS